LGDGGVARGGIGYEPVTRVLQRDRRFGLRVGGRRRQQHDEAGAAQLR